MLAAEEDPSQAKVLLVWRDEGEDENGVGNVFLFFLSLFFFFLF